MKQNIKDLNKYVKSCETKPDIADYIIKKGDLESVKAESLDLIKNQRAIAKHFYEDSELSIKCCESCGAINLIDSATWNKGIVTKPESDEDPYTYIRCHNCLELQDYDSFHDLFDDAIESYTENPADDYHKDEWRGRGATPKNIKRLPCTKGFTYSVEVDQNIIRNLQDLSYVGSSTEATPLQVNTQEFLEALSTLKNIEIDMDEKLKSKPTTLTEPMMVYTHENRKAFRHSGFVVEGLKSYYCGVTKSFLTWDAVYKLFKKYDRFLEMTEPDEEVKAVEPKKLPLFNDVQIGYLKTAVDIFKFYNNDMVKQLEQEFVDSYNFLEKLIKDSEK